MKNILNNIHRIKKLDGSNMHEILSGFSRSIKDAHNIGSDFKLPANFKKNYESIVFSGLGGSAIGADFIKSFLEDELTLPIIVNRDYSIPALVNNKTLFIVSSYSGNTEETISAYNAAKKKGANILVLSSGGKLMDSAVKSLIPFIRIPGKLPPRLAFSYGTIPFLSLFSSLGLVSSKTNQINETERLVSRLKDEFQARNPRRRNPAKKIAAAIYNKFPVIYASSRSVGAVATRWRGQFAENSKTLSSSHLFPEMNHNEIVGWVHPKMVLDNFVVILLKDKDDHPRVKKRMDITKSIIKKMGVDVIEVESRGKGLLSRLFSLVYIGDWVSFYLAILNKVDPTPVERINYLKKKLSE